MLTWLVLLVHGEEPSAISCFGLFRSIGKQGILLGRFHAGCHWVHSWYVQIIIWCEKVVNILHDNRFVLVHCEACISKFIHTSLSNFILRSTDCVIQIILQLDVLQSVISNQEWPKCIFIELDKPVDEGAGLPRGWLVLIAEQVRWTSTYVWNHRFIFIGVHDLLIHAHSDLRGMSIEMAKLQVTVFWRYKNLLHLVHEGTKDERGEHHEHQSRGHHKVIVIFRVAVLTGVSIWLIMRNLEHEGECDCTSDHTSICYED